MKTTKDKAMTEHFQVASLPELMDHPEMATLYVLEAALRSGDLALAASKPEIALLYEEHHYT